MAISSPALRFHAAHPERSLALLTASILAGPAWQARWSALNQDVAALAGRVLKAGVDRGELSTGLDIPLAVAGYLSLYLAVLLGGLTGAYGPVEGWEAMLRRLLAQHLAGARRD